MEYIKGKSRPNVLVAIIVHHREQFLDRSIQSVLLQLSSQDRLLIVDNESKKCIQKIIKEYERNNSQVIIIKSRSSNIANARNLAFQYCLKNNYKYCLFLDDDCVASSNWINSMIISHLDTPVASAVIGEVTYVPKNNVYSILEQQLWNSWIAINYRNKKIKVVDTKNSLFYIPNMSGDPFVSGKDNRREDMVMSIDLGLRGKIILFNRKAIVFHYERSDFISYLAKRCELITSDKTILKKYTQTNIKSNSIMSELRIIKKISYFLLNRRRYLDVFKLFVLCALVSVWKVLTWLR